MNQTNTIDQRLQDFIASTRYLVENTVGSQVNALFHSPIGESAHRISDFMLRNSNILYFIPHTIHFTSTPHPFLYGSLFGLSMHSFGDKINMPGFKVELFQTNQQKIWTSIALLVSHCVFKPRALGFISGFLAAQYFCSHTPPGDFLSKLLNRVFKKFVLITSQSYNPTRIF